MHPCRRIYRSKDNTIGLKCGVRVDETAYDRDPEFWEALDRELREYTIGKSKSVRLTGDQLQDALFGKHV